MHFRFEIVVAAATAMAVWQLLCYMFVIFVVVVATAFASAKVNNKYYFILSHKHSSKDNDTVTRWSASQYHGRFRQLSSLPMLCLVAIRKECYSTYNKYYYRRTTNNNRQCKQYSKLTETTDVCRTFFKAVKELVLAAVKWRGNTKTNMTFNS